MNSDFILEIGCEELPPNVIESSLRQLKEKLHSLFTESSITISSPPETYGTLRRLVIHIPGVPATQEDRQNEITGPPCKVAFDSEGNPTKAGLGFASKMGVSLDSLETKQTDRGEYLLYRQLQKGKRTVELLQDALPGIITKISFPKTMRWSDRSIKFSRPISWILALFGGEVIPFSLDGIKSDAFTYGHPRLNKNGQKVTDFSEYQRFLADNGVILDIDEREKRIAGLLADEAAKRSGRLIPDSQLLKISARCSEYPEVIYGQFKPAFLDIPKPVLITSMRTHQKFFALEDNEANLLPGFLYVTDSPNSDKSLVARGNETVLEARLSDAQFFYGEDLKEPLRDRFEATAGIILHEKLGSMADKTARLDTLSPQVCEQLFPGLGNTLGDSVKQANRLLKTDLTTLMVGEFPELQGVMGGIYARVQDEDERVAQALYEHYLPRWADDDLPESELGTVLSIADKLDTLCGYFCINQIPTGSEDPFALRRQTIGILNIIIQKGLLTDLLPLIIQSLENFQLQGIAVEREKVVQSITIFFQKRLEAIALERGFRYDNINACLETAWNNPVDFFARLDALTPFRSRHDFEDLIVAFRRAARIIPADHEVAFVESLLQDDAEKKLYSEFQRISPQLVKLVAESHYEKAFSLLAEIKPTVDTFFDTVMVMCDDESLRNNRLALLRTIVVLFTSIADFRQIVISQDS